MLKQRIIPIITSILKGGSRQEILGEGGVSGCGTSIKDEPAIKMNAKPFTALGPGPGKFCILDALWCILRHTRGKKNGIKHKPLKCEPQWNPFGLTASSGAAL